MKSTVARIALMAMLLQADDRVDRRYPDKLDGIDIEKEYELIQQKRCMHPVSIRNLIVYRYEKAMRDADDLEARQALEESSGPMDED